LNILKIVAFASIGIVLFWLVYRDQDVDTIVAALKKADFKWILISLFFGLLSHISRAYRWRLLIEPMGYKPKRSNLFLAILIMYLTNYAIPRSGEVIRCGLVNRYEKIPFSKVLGTVFTERIFDFVALIIFLVLLFLTQFSVVSEFFKNNFSQNPDASTKMQNIVVFMVVAAIAGILGLVLLFIFRKKLKTTKLYIKLEEIIKNFLSGLKSIWYMERKWNFMFQTIFMWVMYFLMLYACFFSFEFTRHLSPLAALSVVVLASFGMVIPSPGGMGAWHFLAIQTLVIYGVTPNPDGNAFAIAAHESQTIFLVIAGLISFILLPIVNSKYKVDEKEEEKVEEKVDVSTIL